MDPPEPRRGDGDAGAGGGDSGGLDAGPIPDAGPADAGLADAGPADAGPVDVGCVAETCNGADDDCDSAIDESIPDVTCGLGICMTTVSPACVGGMPVGCAPGPASPEVCNEVDDDCDGVVDNGCTCARYVLLGAAGTGTRPLDPMGSIQSAIDSLAAAGTPGEVCVAAQAASGGCTRTVYLEDVTMAEGVDVLGGFEPSGWSRARPGCVTVIHSNRPIGLLFGHGLTNETLLDGFEVRTTSAGTTTAAITVQQGGVLSNLAVTGSTASNSIGIDFTAPMTGPGGAPQVTASTITAARAEAMSMGVRVQFLSPIISSSTITGGASTTASRGIEVRAAPGTVIAGNVMITGGAAPSSIGVRVTGDTTGIRVASNGAITAQGGAMGSTGVLFEACPVAGTVPASIADNTRIAGGASGSPAVGVRVLTGCSVAITGNVEIVGRQGGSGDAAGIWCRDVGTSCDVSANGRIRGLVAPGAATAAQGILFDTGAFGLVLRNESIIACATPAGSCQDVAIDGAPRTPLVEGNVVGPSMPTVWGFGIGIGRAAAVVSNNEVRITAGSGIFVDATRTATSTVEPTIHSNTVVGLPGLDDSGGLITIEYEDPWASRTPFAIFRNNVAVCLGSAVGSTTFSFAEYGNAADPRVLENNDFFGCTALYRNHGGSNFTSIATMESAVNAEGGTATGNVSTDPMFLAPATDHHLSPMSPVIDRGTSAPGLPASDFDGDPRPRGAGPDIGFDEAG